MTVPDFRRHAHDSFLTTWDLTPRAPPARPRRIHTAHFTYTTPTTTPTPLPRHAPAGNMPRLPAHRAWRRCGYRFVQYSPYRRTLRAAPHSIPHAATPVRHWWAGGWFWQVWDMDACCSGSMVVAYTGLPSLVADLMKTTTCLAACGLVRTAPLAPPAAFVRGN